MSTESEIDFISLPFYRSILVLVDFNEDSIKTLKREIDESNVSGEAHITPRTSVSVRTGHLAIPQSIYVRIWD